MRKLCFVLSLAGAMCIGNVNAQVVGPGNLTTQWDGTAPAQPVVGEPFLLVVRSGPCEPVSADPNSAVITLANGSTFDVEVPGSFLQNCSATPRNAVFVMPPIATPGVYTMRLRINDEGNYGTVGTRLIELVAAGASYGVMNARPIPVLGPWSLVLLVAGTLTVAMRRK